MMECLACTVVNIGMCDSVGVLWPSHSSSEGGEGEEGGGGEEGGEEAGEVEEGAWLLSNATMSLAAGLSSGSSCQQCCIRS